MDHETKRRETMIEQIGDKLILCYAHFLISKGDIGRHSLWNQFCTLERQWWDGFGGRYDQEIHDNLCHLIDKKQRKDWKLNV